MEYGFCTGDKVHRRDAVHIMNKKKVVEKLSRLLSA